MPAHKPVFIPHAQLDGDLKICRSNKGNWYSANMWHNHYCQNPDGSPTEPRVYGIQMTEPEILSNLSAALTEVDEIQKELDGALHRVEQLRKFAARLYASDPLKVVSDV